MQMACKQSIKGCIFGVDYVCTGRGLRGYLDLLNLTKTKSVVTGGEVSKGEMKAIQILFEVYGKSFCLFCLRMITYNAKNNFIDFV